MKLLGLLGLLVLLAACGNEAPYCWTTTDDTGVTHYYCDRNGYPYEIVGEEGSVHSPTEQTHYLGQR